ncbi:hypothetical protein H6F43_14675 [Leptolyngbya sp. FACHB-36]|uniref:type IV pilin-like G/H family protein n=1 Tax=Leptolyngbya sp. FACHB-36 TaxID=2692808 RepID=UPI0016802D38|nr:type IV pilin-like G/H family protein [Leptolyngbya sp. FACHB-36]MBD2021421.1 hypothetical protein [Leptolyngbya sp. FACHB-36]
MLPPLPTSAQSPPPAPQQSSAPIPQQLLGRWEARLPIPAPTTASRTVTLIFDSQGNLFSLEKEQKEITRFKYRIEGSPSQVLANFGFFMLLGNVADQQMLLTVLIPPTTSVSPSQNLAAIDLRQWTPSDLLIRLRKISSDTTLPPGVPVVDPDDQLRLLAERARESEARTYIGSMNRVQQAYFLEKNRFGTLAELQLGQAGPSAETRNYRFQVRLSGDRQSAQNVAIPTRDGLKSYVGLVTTRSEKGEVITITALCASQQPTRQVPAFSKPRLVNKQLQCPTGYTRLN